MIRKLNLKCGSWLRAEKKAADVAPLVRLSAVFSAWAAFYFVRGSGGGFYRVALCRDASGVPCASCDCPAGLSPASSVFCYHVAAVVARHSAFVSGGYRPPLLPFAPSGALVQTVKKNQNFCYLCDSAPIDWIDEAEMCIREMPDEQDDEKWQEIFANVPAEIESQNKIRNVAHRLSSTENMSELDIGDIDYMARMLFSSL